MRAPHNPCFRRAIEDEIYALSLEKRRWSTAGDFDELADHFDDDLVVSTSPATSPPSRSGSAS